MKKHYKYLNTFVKMTVLLGLSVAALSDAGEGQEPANPSDSWDT